MKKAVPSSKRRFPVKRPVIGFRVAPYVQQRIEESAKAAGHSVSDEIHVRLLQAYLDTETPLAKMLPSTPGAAVIAMDLIEKLGTKGRRVS